MATANPLSSLPELLELPELARTPSTSTVDEKKETSRVLTWHGPDDPKCPFNWTERLKWTVSSVLLINTFILPLNGTGITIAADQLATDFDVTDSMWFTNTYWIVTSWSVGGAFVVLFGMPLLEDLGIKRVYLLFSIVNILMIVGQAVAQNFATLVATRFFSGGCTALLANAISSVIADLWDTAEQRSVPVAIYILLYVLGNTAGPVIFAAVIPATGNWRWYVNGEICMHAVY